MLNGPGLNVFEAARPSDITVTAFGFTWTLDNGPAYHWIGAAGSDLDVLGGIFPGLTAADSLDDLWEFSSFGDFDKRCTLAARMGLGRAAGKDWWWTVNMIRKILGSWPIINGVMLREGIRARELLLPDYLDAVYSYMWQHGKDEDRMKLDVELAQLPKGVRVKQSPAQVKAMLARFAAD